MSKIEVLRSLTRHSTCVKEHIRMPSCDKDFGSVLVSEFCSPLLPVPFLAQKLPPRFFRGNGFFGTNEIENQEEHFLI